MLAFSTPLRLAHDAGTQAVGPWHGVDGYGAKPAPEAPCIGGDDLVFKGHEPLVATGVALTSAAARKLPINTPRLVPFGRNSVQAAALCHPWSQRDISPPASHICRHHDALGLTGM